MGGLQKKSKKKSFKNKVAPMEKVEAVAKPYEEEEVLHCSICNVDFADNSKKEKHFKYSTWHELNIKNGKTADVMVPTSIDADNKDAKLVYRGSKFMVQYACQLDVYVYEQPSTNARQYKRLAVIGYNVDKEEEYPALYLNGDLVEIYVQEAAGSEKNPGRNLMATVSDAALQYKMDIGEYLMNRITYENPGVSIVKSVKECSLIVSGPKELLDKNIVRRRRQSIAIPFEVAAKKYAIDQAALTHATANAAKLANKAHASVDLYEKTYGSGIVIPSTLTLLSTSFAAPLKRLGSTLFNGVKSSPRRMKSTLFGRTASTRIASHTMVK